jgi:tRNA 2-selenouridine synthase
MVHDWIDQVQQGQTETVVHALLALHYDPVYAASIRRNFVHYSQAQVCALPSRSPADMAAAASTLISADQAG